MENFLDMPGEDEHSKVQALLKQLQKGEVTDAHRLLLQENNRLFDLFSQIHAYENEADVPKSLRDEYDQLMRRLEPPSEPRALI